MLACLELADESGTAAYQPQLKLEVFTSNDRSWPIPISHQTLADDRNPFEAEQPIHADLTAQGAATATMIPLRLTMGRVLGGLSLASYG